MQNEYIIEQIKEAQMVLLGLGEEFDGSEFLRKNPEYIRGLEILNREKLGWMIPGWNRYCAERLGESSIQPALDKVRQLLADKNYFAVSVSVNPRVALTSWKEGRLVTPCGSDLLKQCGCGCDTLADTDREVLEEFFAQIWNGVLPRNGQKVLGVCPRCGSPFILNNIYAEHYNENGYLAQWQLYTKWLQGTLNRRLFVLELGVGMDYPSVIRWPFEKVAYFNHKAFFCRVNDKLYQLTEELAGKGCGISQNAIDWLRQL